MKIIEFIIYMFIYPKKTNSEELTLFKTECLNEIHE